MKYAVSFIALGILFLLVVGWYWTNYILDTLGLALLVFVAICGAVNIGCGAALVRKKRRGNGMC